MAYSISFLSSISSWLQPWTWRSPGTIFQEWKEETQGDLQAKIDAIILKIGEHGPELAKAMGSGINDTLKDVVVQVQIGLTDQTQKFKKVLDKTLNLSDQLVNYIRKLSEEMTPDQMLLTGTLKTMQNVILPLAAFGIFCKGVALSVDYTYHKAIDNMTKPKLAQKTKTIGFASQIHEYLFGPKKKPEAPIFNKELTEQVQGIINSTKNIKKNNGFFQNVILYGPGGTGKTMLAETIAEESGLNYVMMSGGELAQFIKRKEHVGEFNKFWDSVEKSKSPTIVFIDEAESLCKHRWLLDAEHLELSTAFLARTGTPSNQVMIILATNLADYIDEAILNRMTHEISIEAPGLPERIQILWKYIAQFFTSEEERKALFTNQVVESMAKKTDGFTGRSLFQLINLLYTNKSATAENKLTPVMIESLVSRFVAQKKKLQKEGVSGNEVARAPFDKKA